MKKKNLLVVSRSTVYNTKSGGLETHLDNLVKYLSAYFNITVLTSSLPTNSTEKFSIIPEAKKLVKNKITYIFLDSTISGEYGYSLYEFLIWQIPIKRNFKSLNSNFRKRSAEYYKKYLKGDYKVILSQSSAAQDFNITKEKLIAINHGTTLNELSTRFSNLGKLSSISFYKNLFRFILLDIPTLIYEYVANNPKLFRKCTKIILISDRVKNDFFKQHKKFSTKVRVIPNGIDTEKFVPAEKNSLNVIYFGRINSEKGIIDFVKVSEELKEIKFDMYGDGPDAFKITKLLQEKELTNIKYHGSVSNNVISKILATSSIFLFLTKRKEGMPMSILEAMSCGCAVVTTLYDSKLDIKHGYYYVKDYIQAIEVIKEISMKSPSELSNVARSTALEFFSLDKMGDQYKVLLGKYI